MGIFNRPLKGQQQGGPQPMQPQPVQQPVQQQAAQAPTNTVQKNDTKKKTHFKIIRKGGKIVGDAFTPLAIASAVTIRETLISGLYMARSFSDASVGLGESWNQGNASILPGAIAFVGAMAVKKNVYKIKTN